MPIYDGRVNNKGGNRVKTAHLLESAIIYALLGQQVESYFEEYKKEKGISDFEGIRKGIREKVMCDYRDTLTRDIDINISHISENIV